MTAIIMPDACDILMEALSISGTAFYDLVKNTGTPVTLRIYGPDGANEAFDNTKSACFFSPRGGQSVIGPELKVSFQFKLFSGTASKKECVALYRALCDILHEQNMIYTTSGVVMHATKDVEGLPDNDPVEGWPYVLAFFTCTIKGK